MIFLAKVWRLLTTFTYFGSVGHNMLMESVFMLNYSKSMEVCLSVCIYVCVYVHTYVPESEYVVFMHAYVDWGDNCCVKAHWCRFIYPCTHVCVWVLHASVQTLFSRMLKS
jgi:hypothetical protein